MPAINHKQYVVILTATQNITGIIPANEQRVSLEVQNTGANPAFFRFENAVQLDGGDFVLAAGAVRTWHNPETCPRERLNVLSTLGTVFAVLEGNKTQ